MGLNQVLRTTTHRQGIFWRLWLAKRLNRPSRDNYYHMRIAQVVRQSAVKNPNKVKLDQFKIEFAAKRRPTTTDIAKSKSHWIAAVGGNVRRVTKNVNDNGT